MKQSIRHIRYMGILIVMAVFPLKLSAQWNFDIVSVEAYINDHKHNEVCYWPARLWN